MKLQSDHARMSRLSSQATAGDVGAMVELATLYAEGVEGVDDGEPDYVEALRWYKEAAKHDSPEAMLTLSRMYADGEGVERDAAKAEAWRRKAIAEGHVPAMVAHANAYFHGTGVERDYHKAAKWYYRAAINAKTPSPEAMIAYGEMFAGGLGVQRDHNEALAWFGKALDLGCDDALFAIASLHDDESSPLHDHAAALNYYQKAAKRGDTTAMIRIAQMHRDGKGVEPDASKAIKWLKKAAKADSVTAMLELGVLYYEGEHVDHDDDQARQWFEQARDAGHLEAEHWLAKLRGEDVASITEIDQELDLMGVTPTAAPSESESAAKDETSIAELDLEQKQHVAYDGRHIHVLLVEPDADDAAKIVRALERFEYSQFKVSRVERLDEALDVLTQHQIDIILTEMALPDSQGVDTVTTLYNHAKKVPTFVLCSADNDALMLSALKRGAQECVAKGTFPLNELPRSLMHAIQRHRIRMRVVLMAAERVEESKQLNAKVTKLQTQHATLIENNPDGMLVVNPRGEVCFANPTAIKLLQGQGLTLNPNARQVATATGRISRVSVNPPGGKPRQLELHSREIKWNGQPAVMISMREDVG